MLTASCRVRTTDVGSPTASAEAHDVLRKYLASFDAAGAAAASEAKAAATRAVVEAINQPSVFQFDELLVLPGTRAVPAHPPRPCSPLP